MSTEENKAIMRRILEAWNTRNLSIMDALADKTIAADFIVNDKGRPPSAEGREGVKQFFRRVLKNKPDIQITIQDMIAEGDRVAYFITIFGTNTLTGKPERAVDMAIVRFANGLIAEEWSIDMLVEPQA